MIVNQTITTYWTKKSRGGEAAKLRSKVPKSLPIQPIESGANIVEQYYLYHEDNGFNGTSGISESAGFPIIDYVQIEGELKVKYSGIKGVPNGQNPSSTAFTLNINEWGRIIANCRGKSGEDAWTYGSHIVNIYFGYNPPYENYFLVTDPKHEFNRERKLY